MTKQEAWEAAIDVELKGTVVQVPERCGNCGDKPSAGEQWEGYWSMNRGHFRLCPPCIGEPNGE